MNFMFDRGFVVNFDIVEERKNREFRSQYGATRAGPI